MTDVPLRSLTVSDFRRIEGTRVLPLDARVVLIHGSNGTGKTSVLSALEFGLTGNVRSMERQDDRYTAHLPFLGQAYATVRAEVAPELQAGSPGMPLTVSGARIQGTPALTPEAANFYSERCYLDQTSLGRLLELYQHREGKEESALARFVNELLGLERLDAIRTGLHEASDLRSLKKRAAGVENAAVRAKAAAADLEEHNAALADVRSELGVARHALTDAIETLHPGLTKGMNDTELLQFAREALRDDTVTPEATEARLVHQGLIALGGRLSALSESPSMQRIRDARVALDNATLSRDGWLARHGAAIAAWDLAAHSLGGKLPGDPRDVVRRAVDRARSELEADRELRVQAEAASARVATDRAALDQLQSRLEEARDHSSALVESLAALSGVVQDNTCPVCDRDYGETGHLSLAEHIGTKLAQLTAQGQELVDLRKERDLVAARLDRTQLEHGQLYVRLLGSAELEALELRHTGLRDLAHQLDSLEQTIAEGSELEEHQRTTQKALDDLEAASSENQQVRAELGRYATLLEVSVPAFDGSPRTVWQQLTERAATEVGRMDSAAASFRVATSEAERFASALNREARAVALVTNSVQGKFRWEARVAETKRRQTVAKEVLEAANRARAAVVQRVFTESLNDVWSSVFTRLAPNEGFIPSFGMPTATRSALDIKLETVHRSGEAGGSPQMMLSAGNLNTAALSLFLSLHLAVQPVVPCLVFDDPVQAMDEVHVAQFAGLIRLLAKQHRRQVVIAVHERELFDYLALELSPAYEGDELITIELGERATDADEGITRHSWTRDLAIAG